MAGRRGNDRLRFFGTHMQLVVVGPQVAGHCLGVFRLVVTSLREADGEGAHAGGTTALASAATTAEESTPRRGTPRVDVRYSFAAQLLGRIIRSNSDERRGVTVARTALPDRAPLPQVRTNTPLGAESWRRRTSSCETVSHVPGGSFQTPL
mgnify:CR=1 FL=1